MNNILQLIKNRLDFLYKEREKLTDPTKLWIVVTNGNDRRELIKINKIKIEELESILNHKDLIRDDLIESILN